MEQTYNVGIYCRLSRDDGTDSVSMSISNQRQSLTEYVKNRNWNLVDVYCDDGVSGTTFQRSGFQRLINDIEIGRINCVITKDLSRLGRNYLQAGYYTENYFPDHNVRYIAINDNYDSTQENDFAPFKNIINEWYAKDISKKIRFSLNQKFKEAKVMNPNRPLYGYDHDDEGNRIINEETAPIVKRIFTEYINGKNSVQIAESLKQEHIYCPSYYQYLRNSQYRSKYEGVEDIDIKCNWNSSIVLIILKCEEYLGHLIKHKTTKKSFKSKKTVKVDAEDTYRYENVFPAIITQEEFDITKKILKENERASVPLEHNKYQGVMLCGCCGSILKYHYKGNDRKYKYMYSCDNRECKNKARFALERMDEVIQNEVEHLVDLILNHEDEFIRFVKSYKEIKQPKQEDNSVEIGKLKLEYNKLNKKIEALFEAKLNDEIPSSTYERMMSMYKNQVLEVEEKIRKLESIPKTPQIDYLSEANELIKMLKNNEDHCYAKREFIIRFIQQITVTKKDVNNYSMKLTYISSKIIKEFEQCYQKLQPST